MDITAIRINAHEALLTIIEKGFSCKRIIAWSCIVHRDCHEQHPRKGRSSYFSAGRLRRITAKINKRIISLLEPEPMPAFAEPKQIAAAHPANADYCNQAINPEKFYFAINAFFFIPEKPPVRHNRKITIPTEMHRARTGSRNTHAFPFLRQINAHTLLAHMEIPRISMALCHRNQKGRDTQHTIIKSPFKKPSATQITKAIRKPATGLSADVYIANIIADKAIIPPMEISSPPVRVETSSQGKGAHKTKLLRHVCCAPRRKSPCDPTANRITVITAKYAYGYKC